MSNAGSTRGSISSLSESSTNSCSPNQGVMLSRDGNDFTDLTLYGSSAPLLSRTGTVRRASTVLGPKKELSINGEDMDGLVHHVKSPRGSPELHDRAERYRRSLDSTYRLSLESISEYKTKSSFSALYPSRECSSMDSSSSDATDYAVRSTMTETNKDPEKTLMSPGSSYLSWIESVNSEYFGSAATTADVADVDSKVGEWNNFWLNYNSARGRYLSSPYLSTEERTGDEMSDAKSTSSTQREFTEKMSVEQIVLSADEINEAIKCSQRITEILQNALKRGETEFDDSKNDSFYSQPYTQPPSSAKEEVVVARERSYSYAMDSQEVQKQKQLLKPAPTSSSSSCINALLNTGVADILKRVITKRREVFNPEDFPSAPRGSFSSVK